MTRNTAAKPAKTERQIQAAKFELTPEQWDKACKHEIKYHTTMAVCTRKVGHHAPCIHLVPASYQEPKKLQYHPKEQEQDMAKKADETKGGSEKTTKNSEKTTKNSEKTTKNSEKTTKNSEKTTGRGNPEALAKAREAGAEKRAEQRAKKIKLLVKENPKREGSASYDRFALYKTGMAVGEFLDKGGRSADIAYDVKHNFIEIK